MSAAPRIVHEAGRSPQTRKTHSGISLQGGLYLADGQLCFCGGAVYPVARYDLNTGQCDTPGEDRIVSHAHTTFCAYYPEYGQFVSLNHVLADGRFLNYAADYNHSGAVHSTLALFGARPAGAPALGADWRIVPRRAEPEPKPAVLWEHKRGSKYNSLIVGPGTLLAAGQRPTSGGLGCFLAAVNVEDGSELWREKLPAPAVKAGAAIDHQARIFVSLQDGRLLAWRPAR